VQDGLYVALSAQVALQRRLDTIADNVANAGTVGFRATSVSFEDVMTGLTDKSVAFVSSGENYIPNESGSLRESGNPFDFAVRGDAWFGIQTPAGTVMTKDGRFTMRNTGELVTIEGKPVVDPGGAAIVLDPRGGPPEVGADGVIRQGGKLAGSIGLFEFTPTSSFQRYGNSGFLPGTQPQPAVDRADIGVAQGFVEESNVNPLLEMTHLIQVQRDFEKVSALMRDSDSSMKDAIKTLGS